MPKPKGRTTPPAVPSTTPWSDLLRQRGYDPSPVAVQPYGVAQGALDVAVYACVTSAPLCLRAVADGVWLLQGDVVCTRVEGADHTAYTFTHLTHGPLCVVSLAATEAGSVARVFALHHELRTQVADIWASLSRGIAVALGGQVQP